jgi:hypothetical protein
VQLERLLSDQSGIVTRQQAVAALGPSRVRHLVETGRWQRVCRGVLAVQPGELRREQRWWAAVLAAGAGAVLAGRAAAEAGGLRGPARTDEVDVLVPYGRAAVDLSRQLPWVTVRRTRVLPAADLVAGSPPRTGLARSVVDAAQWAADDDEALLVVAGALRSGAVRADEIRAVLDRMPRAFRRRRVLDALDDIAGGERALAEIDFVRLCRRHRLPPPDRQERRADPSGRVRHLDVRWRRWRVRVMVDGGYDPDRPTDDRVLRFPAHVVRARPEEVAGVLRAAFLAEGWQPGL